MADVEQEQTPAPEAPQTTEATETVTQPETQPEKKQRNRTTEYIERLRSQVEEARREVQELKKQSPKAEPPKRPTLQERDFDIEKWHDESTRYTVQEILQQERERQAKEAEARTYQATVQSYNQRAQQFADEHPDFFEVVGTIPTEFLIPELQSAVMAHEKGPELAYYLANNEEVLEELASKRPEFLKRAIDRLASRMESGANAAPVDPVERAITPQVEKPISRAPAPAPIVSGRAAAPVADEKLTDDQWYKKEQERRRKR